MEKPIYVNLEVPSFADEENHSDILVKRIEQGYKERTFSELLEKMTDPDSDRDNPEPYNAQEIRLARQLENLLNRANTNPGDVHLYAKSISDPPEDINVSLFDKVSDYTESILRKQTTRGDSGETKMHYELKMFIEENEPGGICNENSVYR